MNYKEIQQQAAALFAQTATDRRNIHSHPELSFQEHQTSQYIAERLEAEGIAYRPIAGTGILAKIEGSGDLRRCVVLRADMDALPIEEENALSYRSCNEGVMHACGHDMHTACLLGALTLLHRHRNEIQGTLFGLFQPGEEVAPGGASKVMAEDPFRDYHVVAFVGEHVGPELPAGCFGFRAGQYMASSDELHLKVHGTGGHGALPHTLTDPVVAAAALITALQQITSRNNNAIIPTVLSIGRVIADGATNIIPSVVELSGTLRTMDEAWRAHAKERIRQIAAGIAEAYGVQVEVELPGGYPCVVNHEELTERARCLARNVWGAEAVRELPLRMTAEDFGTYTQHYPSLFFRLGTARTDGVCCGGLHTATFNPDERALEYGVAMMTLFGLELGV